MKTSVRRGFTLVELLVSISIFAVITAYVTANFHAGSNGDELRLSSQLVASEIRRAQTLTVGGKSAFICAAGSHVGQFCPTGINSECGENGLCSATVPKGGYGIHFNTTETAGADQTTNRQATLFADLNVNGRFDVGEQVRTTPVSPNVNVRVQAVVPPYDSGKLDVVFRLPDATPWVNGDPNQRTAQIQLNHPAIEIPKYVRVNAISGQISAD